MEELISVVFDERAYTLRLQFRDIALAEHKSGLDLMGETAKEFWDIKKAAVYKVAFLLWAAMLHKYPSVTLEEVREWVTPSNLRICTETIAKLMARDVQPVFDALEKDQKSQEPSEDPFTETGGSGLAASPESI
ncbi:MAG: hypothetical protein QM757_16575 [Paludibaculum sp.]